MAMLQTSVYDVKPDSAILDFVDPRPGIGYCRIELVPYRRELWLGAMEGTPILIDPTMELLMLGDTRYEIDSFVSDKLLRD